ncbi:hypothetical protein M407DRAFT_119256 [Tulasnella calospora MUT 4182]|uniref:Mug135-like C-terminal domain-containing protein n=1 Tax=Tulasnella calospora MUT 4182 TaxID=1051891 RepID=A0A0C3LLS1_9AGAM|nr:hypothetical protein M407DRAFT_119256 [Tulasnella calospora MUT 4182]
MSDKNPPLQVSELGQLHVYRAEIVSKIQAREATLEPQPGSNEAVLAALREMREEMREMREEMREADANILTRLTTVETKLTTVETKLNTVETNLKSEFKTFRTTIGLWSRPAAQRFNRESVLDTDFQAVPYPSGEFPDNEIMAHLRSRDSISNLDMNTLTKICKDYGIRYPRMLVARNEVTMKRQLINYLCGLPYRTEDVEGDN